MADITLKLNNKEFSGWKEAEVQLGIDQIAGHFSLSLTDKWDDCMDAGGRATQEAKAEESMPVHPIQAGASCELLIGSQVIITGYVDEASPDYDAGDHTVTVTGRDRTADLVDCSAIYKTGQWQNRNLLQIASDLCAPFGITVIAETNVGPAFSTWKIQEGETVFECLDRAARIRGVLLTTDGKGNLIITRAGTDRATTPLVLGENIKAASGGFDHTDRFSKIIVKGDHAGNDDAWGEQVIERVGSAKDDKRIGRYRPLIILAEDQVDNAAAQQRAQWEVNRRFGASLSRTYTVQGWRQDNGQLWRFNQLIMVDDPLAVLHGEYLISNVTYRIGENGTETDITITRPQAFDLIPLPEPKEKEAIESWAV